MARDNGGVARRVYDNVGQGSVNRGSGQEGQNAPEGGLMPVGYEVKKSDIRGQGEMNSITGPAGSSGIAKEYGGVGNYGSDDSDHIDFFKTQH